MNQIIKKKKNPKNSKKRIISGIKEVTKSLKLSQKNKYFYF